MYDQWEVCEEFPRYLISPYGEIRHRKNNSVKHPQRNQNGVTYVSIYDSENKRPRTRSVASLVAKAYVPKEDPSFDTVVHLDGDRANVNAENLIWRPRPFAISYHKEINRLVPVRDYRRFYCLDTGEQHDNVFDLAMQTGSLPSRISRSIILNDDLSLEQAKEEWWKRTVVWPLGLSYRSTIY